MLIQLLLEHWWVAVTAIAQVAMEDQLIHSQRDRAWMQEPLQPLQAMMDTVIAAQVHIQHHHPIPMHRVDPELMHHCLVQ